MATGCLAKKNSVRPLALRHRLSSAVPLSVPVSLYGSHAQNFTILSVGRHAGLHTQPFARAGQKPSGSSSSVYHKCPQTTSKCCKNEEEFQSGIVFLCKKSPLIGHNRVQSGPFAYKVKRKRVKPQLLQAHRWCWCRSAEIRSHAGFLRSSRCG